MNQKNSCLICMRRDDEMKITLNLILKRLKRISNQYIPDYREHTDLVSKGLNGFSRLLMVIIGNSATSQDAFHKCFHDKFTRYLKRKLKCDNNTFNNFCNELVEKLAERNYHLDVINSQLRNISETCIRLSQLEQANQIKQEMDKKKVHYQQVTLGTVPSEPSIMPVVPPRAFQSINMPQYNCQNPTYPTVPIFFLGVGMNTQILDPSLFSEKEQN